MLNGIVYLSWTDTISLTLTVSAIVLVQLLNTFLSTAVDEIQSRKTITTTATATETKLVAPTKTTTATTATTTTTPIAEAEPQREQQICAKLQKQSSGQCEIVTNSPTSASSSSSCHPVDFIVNGGGLHPLVSDPFSEEFHEDEDTLSLENLFPCDQREIYASKKICFIIDELIQTEANYVTNLRTGLTMYGNLHQRPDLPPTLQDETKCAQVLGNIADILTLNEQHILAMMDRNRHDLKQLFDDFSAFFDSDHFYCYVLFTMNKRSSLQLRQEHRQWFTEMQRELDDRLGIDSFLVQPIQRLTRYPLLLQQFITELYKTGISCKPVLVSACKLETRMRRLLEIVNQAEELPAIEECNDMPTMWPPSQGHFRRACEFEAYHHRTRKRYRAKVFVFDRGLIGAEMRKRRLIYRCHYPWTEVEVRVNSSKAVTVVARGRRGSGLINGLAATETPKDELDLIASESCAMGHWLRCVRKILDDIERDNEEAERISLPMDVVLGAIFIVWLMWQYFY